MIDFNNSLRLFNFDSGQYEVCIEFQSALSAFIYQPRDGCIVISIGKSTSESFSHSSTPLLIALASGIILFFILGLVVQWTQAKRRKKAEDDDEEHHRSRSSSVLSTLTLKQQRDRLIGNFFHRYIDQPRSSRLRQWARNRAFRHCISTQEQEFERPRTLKRLSQFFSSATDQLSQSRSQETIPTISNLTTNDIKDRLSVPSRNVSFHLSPLEEHEMV